MQYSSSLCTPKPSRRTLYHKQQPNFPAAIRNRSLPWEEEVEGYVRTKRSPFTCRMPVIQLPSLPISLQPSKGWVDEEAWQLDNWHPACELVTLHCRMDDIRTLESAESIALYIIMGLWSRWKIGRCIRVRNKIQTSMVWMYYPVVSLVI